MVGRGRVLEEEDLTRLDHKVNINDKDMKGS